MDQSKLLNLNIANQALYNTIKYQTVTGAEGPPGPTGPAGISTNTGATGTYFSFKRIKFKRIRY